MGEKERIQSEKERRLLIWNEIKGRELTSSEIQNLGIYKGQAGIYRSLPETKAIVNNGFGMAMGLSHSGKHYPDEVSDDFIIYHYPKTERPGDYDLNEIESTKNCMRHNVPLFVILRDSGYPIVKLGWVASFDDSEESFLVNFSEGETELLENILDSEIEFKMIDKSGTKTVTQKSKVRTNQTRFRYNCLIRYSGKCAVCDVSEKLLLQAAHIYPKSKNGSDHSENGLILCATHHLAFDNNLFGINPENYQLAFAKSTSEKRLQITRKDISHLENLPNQEPLEWRWKEFKKK